MVNAAADSSVFPYEVWTPQLAELAERFAAAEPFPHVVLDDFLRREAIEQCLADFPQLDSGDWINYTHFNERKFGRSQLEAIPGANRRAIDELNSPRFVDFLTKLTGIEGLFADPALMGGGLHQSPRGGFLNVHADFTGHQHQPTWQRRVNVLVYLNEDWQPEFGGDLELWTRDMQRCAVKVPPVLNRAVIFETGLDSFHGHPEPLTCPPDRTRKSIALYYFTDEKQPFRVRSTEYRSRPGEGLRAVPIWLDKLALRAYDSVKRRLHLSDDFASSLLGRLGRRGAKRERAERPDSDE